MNAGIKTKIEKTLQRYRQEVWRPDRIRRDWYC